jgi:hypothetical protein
MRSAAYLRAIFSDWNMTKQVDNPEQPMIGATANKTLEQTAGFGFL